MSAANTTELIKTIPEIIEAASKSPLGILALMVVALALLAYFYFKDAGQRTRVRIFMVLFLGVVLYATAIVRESGSGAQVTSSPGSERGADSNASSDSEVHVRGQITDEQDVALESVLVVSVEGLAPVFSDSNGIFDLVVSLTPGQTSVLKLSKTGFLPQSEIVRPPVGSGLQIKLRRLTESPAQVKYDSAGVSAKVRGFLAANSLPVPGETYTDDELTTHYAGVRSNVPINSSYAVLSGSFPGFLNALHGGDLGGSTVYLMQGARVRGLILSRLCPGNTLVFCDHIYSEWRLFLSDTFGELQARESNRDTVVFQGPGKPTVPGIMVDYVAYGDPWQIELMREDPAMSGAAPTSISLVIANGAR
jgi:hypothetical protein